MIKYFNYILIFIIIIHLLQFLSCTIEDFTNVIWNYPTRINNYVYDIRGYPDQYCLDSTNDRKFVIPCFYKNNSKYDVDGVYKLDDNDEVNNIISPYIKDLINK